MHRSFVKQFLPAVVAISYFPSRGMIELVRAFSLDRFIMFDPKDFILSLC